MSFFKKIREKYMKNNFSLAILSVAIAVCLWLFISLTQYPSVQKTIQHIPVTVDIMGSSAGQNGLQVISCSVEEVTVELLGSRTEVGNLNSDNLVAYFDADSVSSAGTKNLTLKIRSDSGINYEVKSIMPDKATVVFDKIETREFPISPKTPNVDIVEGKEIFADDYACDPSVVQITGPSAQLDKISKCYALSKKDMSLSSSYVLSSDEIQLYTEDNILIDQSELRFSNQNFNITIPVRTQKSVGLTVTIINAPENFDQSTIKLRLSADTVTLACNNSETEIPDTISVGMIPLNEIKPGFSKTFSLSTSLESSEFINVSDLQTVTVTLDDNDLTQTDMLIDKSRINISNKPDSIYDYEVLTQQLDVVLVGSEESLAEITPEDIVVEVNLLNASITTDQFNWNATYSCPDYDDVWVITNSKISIQRTPKQIETAAADAFSNIDTTVTTTQQ